MGFEPVTSALPVRCSTNWAMKPHIGSEVNLLSSYLPWGVKWCEVYEIINSYRKLWLNCRPNVTYNTHNVQYAADTWILGWVTNWDDQSWVKYLSCKNSYIHFHKLFLHLKDTVLQTTNRLRLLGWIHKAFLWLDVSEVLSPKNGPLLWKNPKYGDIFARAVIKFWSSHSKWKKIHV